MIVKKIKEYKSKIKNNQIILKIKRKITTLTLWGKIVDFYLDMGLMGSVLGWKSLKVKKEASIHTKDLSFEFKTKSSFPHQRAWINC